MTERHWEPLAVSAAISEMTLVDAAVFEAFGRRDYDSVVDQLRRAVRLRRQLATTPPAQAHLRSALTDAATGLDQAARLAVRLGGASGEPRTAGLLVGAAHAMTDRATALHALLVPPASLAADPSAEADTILAAAEAELRESATLVRALFRGTAELAALFDELLACFTTTPVPDIDEVTRLEEAYDRAAPPGAARQKDSAVLLHATANQLAVIRNGLTRGDIGANTTRSRTELVPVIARLDGYVERWRALLDQDWDKIEAQERATGFLTELVDLLVDLGAVEHALVASERARARAFADLLHQDPSAGPLGVTSPSHAPPFTRTSLRSLFADHGLPAVEYFLSDDRLTTWTADGRGGLTVATRQVDRRWLHATIDALHGLLESPDQGPDTWAETATLLAELGGALWSDVDERLLPGDPDAPVLVVPYGVLLRVPFAALLVEGGPLVGRHALTLLPALSLVARLAARARPAPPTLLALVNPGTDLAWTEERFGKAIAAWYPSATVHYGHDATVAALTSDPDRRSVLYFATHADVVDPPLDSFVALAAHGAHDGQLRARDVLDLRLDADLVILAACRTGGGAVTADGVLGLSRSFLARGPTKLILTLCRVGERASLEVMYRFHEHWLVEGRPAVQALRRAQASLAEESGPNYAQWAPYVHFGVTR